MKKSNQIILIGFIFLSILLSIILIVLFNKNPNILETGFESGNDKFVSGGDTRLEVVNEQSYSDTNALKVSGGTQDWHGARIQGEESGILLDKAYEISAMVYSEDEKHIVMQITLRKADGSKEYRWLQEQVLKPGEWMPYFAEITLSSAEYKEVESISFENKTEPFSGEYYLDEVKINSKGENNFHLIIILAVIITIILLITGLLLSGILSKRQKDALTGVYNRDIIENELPEIIKKAAANQKDASLIMADLDHFKWVNDTYGHSAGDVVLKNFAGMIQNCLGNKEWVSRYGGEEFLIFLPDTNGETARKVAENIRKRLEEISVIADGKNIKVTASFGIASLLENDLKTAEDLIKFADQNLYAAKNSGRNKVCFGSGAGC